MVLAKLLWRCFPYFLPLAGSLAAKPEAIFVVVADQHSAYERTAQVVARIDRLVLGADEPPLLYHGREYRRLQ